MLRRIPRGQLFAFVVIVPLVGCGGERVPASPSALGAPTTGPVAATSEPWNYHGPDPVYPDPSPVPTPAPTPSPATALTISIVRSDGAPAFSPNSLPASVGATVVWTNNDVTAHRIVLNDVAGTLIGEMSPGESSAPFTVAEATVRYHCALHPSMMGTIQDPAAASPTPTPAPDSSPRELQGTWVAVYGGQQATLVITETGYEVFYGFEHHVGAIAVRGDQIEFSQSNTCTGGGVYRWSLDGDSLVFRAVGRDSCPGRSTALNNRTYTRSS